MKNGVWVGGLVLSLVAWLPPLFGQGSSWRPPTSPQPISSTALSDLRPCPAATLGKPVALPDTETVEVLPSVQPAAFIEPAAFPRGADDGQSWTDTAEKTGGGSEFAIDRPATPTVAAPVGVAGLQLAGVGTALDASIAIIAAPAPGDANATSVSIPVTEAEVRYPKFYISGEYLLWWLKQDKVPVLAATSSNPFDNGELGKPTTQVLFGGGGLNGSDRSGGRITAGWWLDDACQDVAVEVRGFYLAPQTTNFFADSSQYPVIARPFFNINMQEEFAQLTATPGNGVSGSVTGNITINSDSKFYGAELNGRCNLCCGCDYRLDLLGGFRYLDLEETLNITEHSLNNSTLPPFPGDASMTNDFFSTRNQFYGGQVGILGEYDHGPFSVEMRAQVALGDTHQDILIDGSQVFTDPKTGNVLGTFKGGLLALTSNIGRYSLDRFGVIPELNLNVGYQLTEHIRAFIGYDVLYWNDVLRPGGQIDRNIDITLIPNFPVPGEKPAGQNQPSVPRSETDFWAQGVTVGVEIRY
jgi:hypothetical protein